MYEVSAEYLEALKLSTRSDRIAGTITLPGSEDSISIDDENLVSGTLKIVRELCGDSYRIGTFNLSSVSFSVFTDSGPGTDFTGASVELSYFLDIGEGVYEEIPLGKYLIDPVLSTRRKNILSVIAYDEGIKTDRAPSAGLRSMEGTPAELIAAVCEECGLDTDIEAGSLDGFPNSGLTVRADNAQIQSCRDIIMWCASLICGYAVVTRESKLAVIPAKYSVTGSGTVIVCDRTIEEDERNSIYVTDTRAYIKYLTGYEGNKIVNYTSGYVPEDEQASPAAYVLEKNPLLSSADDAVFRNANMAWLAYIDSFKQRGVRAEIFGDPAIDTGDTIMFTGGDVDQRHGIIGVVTSCEWRYRGYQDIVCSAAVCTAGAEVSSGIQSRGQSEKRVDAIQPSGVGEWLDEEHTIERFNDYEYNMSDMDYDHICGMNNVSDSESDGGYGYNLFCGYGNRNYGYQARDNIIAGNTNTNRGYSNMLGGQNNTNTGNKNVTAGQNNTVSAFDSIVAGQYNTV
ncbi:MAG: hypothetical protein J6X60_08220, partial [Ruminiclostridium sp.]|nr:hypothetical protein [Ruminiclostridium sp.]